MSIDLFKRMDYAEVFDFDKFHEVFRQQLFAAKGGERFTLKEYIEDHHEFWRDYDVTKSAQIAEVLEIEVSDIHGLSQTLMIISLFQYHKGQIERVEGNLLLETWQKSILRINRHPKI